MLSASSRCGSIHYILYGASSASGVGPVSVHDDEQEADQGEDEGHVDGGHAEDDLLVDEVALERWHECAADDGHDEEGCAEVGVLRVHVLEGDAVDAGEHDGHEEADGDEGVEAAHAFDADGAEGADGGSDAEDGQELAGVDVAHDVGAEEAAEQVHRHGDDVVHLCGGLVDAEVVGVLDDVGPHHDLGADVADLCEDSLAVDGVVPEVGEGLLDGVGLACGLLLLALGLRHLGQGDDGEDGDDDESDGDVGIADDGEVVQSDVGLLSFGEEREDDLSGGVALVGEQVRQHDEGCHSHAAERADGIECLCQVQSAGRGLFVAERKDERIGGRLEKCESERQDIERDAEERELLPFGCRDEEEGSDGIECQAEQDAALVGIFADEQGGRNRHRGISAVEGELDERGFRHGDFHDGLEGCHHRVGDVVGESPQGEQRRDEYEREEVFLRY